MQKNGQLPGGNRNKNRNSKWRPTRHRIPDVGAGAPYRRFLTAWLSQSEYRAGSRQNTPTLDSAVAALSLKTPASYGTRHGNCSIKCTVRNHKATKNRLQRASSGGGSSVDATGNDDPFGALWPAALSHYVSARCTDLEQVAEWSKVRAGRAAAGMTEV